MQMSHYPLADLLFVILFCGGLFVMAGFIKGRLTRIHHHEKFAMLANIHAKTAFYLNFTTIALTAFVVWRAFDLFVLAELMGYSALVFLVLFFLSASALGFMFWLLVLIGVYGGVEHELTL